MASEAQRLNDGFHEGISEYHYPQEVAPPLKDGHAERYQDGPDEDEPPPDLSGSNVFRNFILDLSPLSIEKRQFAMGGAYSTKYEPPSSLSEPKRMSSGAIAACLSTAKITCCSAAGRNDL